jgi:hypothetical protein
VYVWDHLEVRSGLKASGASNSKDIINIEKTLYNLYVDYMTRNFQQPTIYIFETFSGKIKNIMPAFHKRIGKEPFRYLGIKHHMIKANYI